MKTPIAMSTIYTCAKVHRLSVSVVYEYTSRKANEMWARIVYIDIQHSLSIKILMLDR